MVRSSRRLASEDEDTPSGPTTPVRNKMNGTTSAQVKSEKVNGKGKGKARELDHDEQDEKSDEATQDGENSPKGRKRARANTAGEANSSVLANTQEPSLTQANVKTLDRDPADGFIPGSIVRVKLHNFMTYEDVEFRCGPYLNMILGPNGTGKSSIANAICIGLNFPPSVLGRANEVSAFVKDQHDSGYTEIELKGKPGKGNLTIGRTLFANKKSTAFTLNGKTATGKEVNEKIAELNIQISNLCSFLPQDKVSEFARMTPVQLLRETQRTAGDKRLTEWHDTLIDSGKQMREVFEKLNTDREALKIAQDRNEGLERDVARFNERKKLEADIKLLELAIPFVQYLAARDMYNDIKIVQRKKRDRAKTLEARHKPALEFKTSLEHEKNRAERKRKDKQKGVANSIQQIKHTHDRAENLDREQTKHEDKLTKVREEEVNRKLRIDEFKGKVDRFKHQLANPPDTSDWDAVQAELKELQDNNRHVIQQQAELHSRQGDLRHEISHHQERIEKAQHLLHRLNSMEHQKLDALRKWDYDCAEVVAWLRNNQHRFQMEVLEPPIVTLGVRDPRYADAIDACFNSNQLRTFVTQCAEDNKLFNRLVNDTNEALNKKVKVNTWFRPRHNVPPPPMSQEEMRGLGFDTYAIDLVDFPDGLLWYLQSAIGLHRTPIALNPRGVDTNQAMQAVSNAGGSVNFIVGKVYNTVTRSAYGQRLATNTTRDVPASRNFTTKNVDEGEKRAQDDAIKEARAHIADLELRQRKLSEEEQQLRRENAKVTTRQGELTKRKAEITSARGQQKTLQRQIETIEKQIKELQLYPSSSVAEAKIKEDIILVAQKRLKSAKQLQEYIRQAIVHQNEATALGLDFIQVNANLIGFTNLLSVKAEQLQKAMAEFVDADKQYQELKIESHAKLKLSKDKLENAEVEIQEMFRDMKDGLETQKEDVLQQELEDMNAKLDMYTQTNSGVIDQYERRKLEIANLQKTIASREQQEQALAATIKTAQDNWQPRLEELVNSIGARFSAAFDSIGCAGEIKISQALEFEKWAIDIMVKFRSEEKLQLLTGQRQSGGERALTTIMYLMSLTEEARAPFSLVDEINQGMDARYERMVHNTLVRTTCQKDSCQYFLITPKLLPGLEYHERMKVLCVYNGEWMPETRGVGNLKSLLENYARHNRGGANQA